MKKLILISLLALFSCDNRNNDIKPTSYINEDISIVEIDSCEYIRSRIFITQYGYYVYSHKGNCKYCAQRNKQITNNIVHDTIWIIK